MKPIPDMEDRTLTNDYIVYRNKVIVLPDKRNLVKQARMVMAGKSEL